MLSSSEQFKQDKSCFLCLYLNRRWQGPKRKKKTSKLLCLIEIVLISSNKALLTHHRGNTPKCNTEVYVFLFLFFFSTSQVGFSCWMSSTVAALFVDVNEYMNVPCPPHFFLGGGFKYFFFSPLFGEDSHLD